MADLELTRRDYFAAMAMQALIQTDSQGGYLANKEIKNVLDYAVTYADLLIDELDAKPDAKGEG